MRPSPSRQHSLSCLYGSLRGIWKLTSSFLPKLSTHPIPKEKTGLRIHRSWSQVSPPLYLKWKTKLWHFPHSTPAGVRDAQPRLLQLLDGSSWVSIRFHKLEARKANKCIFFLTLPSLRLIFLHAPVMFCYRYFKHKGLLSGAGPETFHTSNLEQVKREARFLDWCCPRPCETD